MALGNPAGAQQGQVNGGPTSIDASDMSTPATNSVAFPTLDTPAPVHLSTQKDTAADFAHGPSQEPYGRVLQAQEGFPFTRPASDAPAHHQIYGLGGTPFDLAGRVNSEDVSVPSASSAQPAPFERAPDTAKLSDTPAGPDKMPAMASSCALPAQLLLDPASPATITKKLEHAASQPETGQAASKAAGSYDLELLQQMHVCTVGVLGFLEGQHHAVVIGAAEELCGQHGPVQKACCYSNKQNRPFALVKMASAENALTAVQVS